MEQSAELFVCVSRCQAFDCRGGVKSLISQGELTVMSIVPTVATVAQVNSALHLPPGTLSVEVEGEAVATAPNETAPPPPAIVFLSVGDVRLPLSRNVVVVKISPLRFTFALPNFMLEICVFESSDAAEEEELTAFEDILEIYTTLRRKPGGCEIQHVRAQPAPDGGSLMQPQHPVGCGSTRPSLSTRVASGIGKVASVAAKGLSKGASLIAKGIHAGTDKVVDHTTPCAQPAEVSSETKQHVQRLRTMSKGAVMVSSMVAQSVVAAAAVTGNLIGNRISAHVSQPPGTPEDSVRQQRMAGALEIGRAVVRSAGVLFDATQEATKTILTSSCEGISKVVTHKMGPDAGQTTAEGLGVVADVVDVRRQLTQAGVRGFVSAAAGETASTINVAPKQLQS